MIAEPMPLPTLPADRHPSASARIRSLPVIILLFSLMIHAFIGFFALRNGASGASGQDFFIMYTGTAHAVQGKNPYTWAYMRAALRARASQKGDDAVLDGGFFYPPQSMLLFRPFCALPFSSAYFCWYVFNTLLIIACGGLIWVEGGGEQQVRLAASIVVACMLVNPLMQRMLSLGQTPMIVPGAFVIGHLLIKKHWRWLGPAVFSFAAIKPHLALPLLAIMPLLYGWRETLRCGGFVVLFNLLGCLLTTGSLSTLSDFLHFASTAPLSIGFNQVTYDQIISWNRILYVFSGIAINLSVAQIIAGYLVVAAFFGARVVWIQRTRPSPSLLVAMAAMASLLCSQPKGYDLVIVVLISPYLWRLWRVGDRKCVATLFILFVAAIVPRGVAVAMAGHLHAGGSETEIILSYRALVVALMFLTILFRGEPFPLEADAMTPEIRHA